MEFNTRNNVKVDLTRLEAEVRAKAAEYLDDITEENLNNVFGIKTKVYYNEISKSLDFCII